MQNVIPVQDLEARLSRANRKVTELQAALNQADDVEKSIDLEQKLAGARSFQARTAAALEQQRAQEQAEREQNEKRSIAERRTELERLHRDGCNSIEQTINRAAMALEPYFAAIQAKRSELSAMSNDYVNLQIKAAAGKHVFSEDLERLSSWPNSVVPGAADPLPDKSALYMNTLLALMTAMHDAVDGPYSLAMVLAASQQLPPTTQLREGAAKEMGAVENKPPVYDPEPTDRSYGTAAQRAGRDRANLRESRRNG